MLFFFIVVSFVGSCRNSLTHVCISVVRSRCICVYNVQNIWRESLWLHQCINLQVDFSILFPFPWTIITHRIIISFIVKLLWLSNVTWFLFMRVSSCCKWNELHYASLFLSFAWVNLQSGFSRFLIILIKDYIFFLIQLLPLRFYRMFAQYWFKRTNV